MSNKSLKSKEKNEDIDFFYNHDRLLNMEELGIRSKTVREE